MATISIPSGPPEINLSDLSILQTAGVYDALTAGADKVTISASNDSGSANANRNTIDAGDGKDSVSIKSSGSGNTFANSNVIGAGNGDNKLIIDVSSKESVAFANNNGFTGTSGKDSIDFKAKGELSTRAIGNTIDAGDGDNKLNIDLSSNSDSAQAIANTFVGGVGKDSVAIKVKSGLVAYSVNNQTDAGDGDNQLKIDASSKLANTSVYGNTFIGGTGKDSVDIKAKANTQAFANINTIHAGDGENKLKIDVSSKVNYSYVQGNVFTSGTGKDSIDIKAKANTQAFASANTIDSGDGENKLKIDVSSKSDELAANSNEISGGSDNDTVEIKAKAESEAQVISNQIDAGDGDNQVKIDVSTKQGGITAAANSVDGGTGNDTIQFKVKAGAEAFFTGNSVDAGDGDNQLKIDASSKGDYSYATGNSFTGEAGNDSIEFKIKADTESRADGNTIDAGDGDNKLKIDVSSKNDFVYAVGNSFTGEAGKDSIEFKLSADIDSSANDNTINSGDGDNELKIDVSSKSDNSYANGNSFTGEAGKDSIEFKVKSHRSSYANGNTIDAGDGENVLKFDVSSKLFSTFADYNEFAGGTGADLVEIKAKSVYSATADNNTIDGGEGDNEFNINVTSKADRASADENEFTGGAGVDLVEINANGRGAHAESNTIHAGDGDNEIKINLSSKNHDAYASDNEFTGGTGADSIAIVANSGYLVSASRNTINGGDGDNEIKIDLSGKDDDNFAISNLISTGSGNDIVELDVEGNTTYLTNNTIDAGDGQNVIKLNATSKVSDTYASYNSISTGSGSDSIEINSKSKGDETFVNRNTLDAGAGNDIFRAESDSSGDDAAEMNENSLVGGEGDDDISIRAVSNESANVFNNTLRAGDESNDDSSTTYVEAYGFIPGGYAGRNYLSASVEGKITAEISGNQLFGSTGTGGSRSINFLTLEGKSDGALQMNSNLLQGGDDYFNRIDLIATNDAATYDGFDSEIENNTLQSGATDASHHINIDVAYGTSVSGNQLLGSGGTDYFNLETLSGLSSSEDGNVQAFLENNTIDGGASTDQLSIDEGGQLIDFSTTNVSGIDDLFVGGKKNTLMLSDADVISMSDTGTLFIFGEGSTTIELEGSFLLGTGVSDGYFSHYSAGGADLFIADGMTIENAIV